MLYNRNNYGLFKVPKLWWWDFFIVNCEGTEQLRYIYGKKGYVMHELSVTTNILNVALSMLEEQHLKKIHSLIESMEAS